MKRKAFDIRSVILFLIIYFSCNSFVLAVKYERKTVQIMVGVCVLTIITALIKGRYVIPKNASLTVFALSFNIFLTAIFNGYLNAYILLVMEFIMAICCIKLFSREEFYEYYIIILKLLSIFAVAVGLINNFAPAMLSGLKIYSLGDNYYYRDAFLSFQAIRLFRINSIWGEPGMYSVFLTFALVFECFFINRKIKIFNLILFSIADILTFSTTGMICLAFLLIALVINNEGDRSKRRIVYAIFAVLILLIFASRRLSFISEQFSGALGKLNQEDLSFIGRLAPVLYNLKQGLISPLFGHGIQGGKFFVNLSFYTGYLYCNTSTTTFIFASFGLLYSSITVILTWKLIKERIRNKMCFVLAFSAIMLSINSQAVHLDQIYYIFLFSLFMYSNPNLELDI